MIGQGMVDEDHEHHADGGDGQAVRVVSGDGSQPEEREKPTACHGSEDPKVKSSATRSPCRFANCLRRNRPRCL
jgi:hypothetical protein